MFGIDVMLLIVVPEFQVLLAFCRGLAFCYEKGGPVIDKMTC